MAQKHAATIAFSSVVGLTVGVLLFIIRRFFGMQSAACVLLALVPGYKAWAEWPISPSYGHAPKSGSKKKYIGRKKVAYPSAGLALVLLATAVWCAYPRKAR